MTRYESFELESTRKPNAISLWLDIMVTLANCNIVFGWLYIYNVGKGRDLRTYNMRRDKYSLMPPYFNGFFWFFSSPSLIDGVTHTTRVNRTAFSCAKTNIIKVDFHYRKWGHGVVDCLRSSTSEQEFNTTDVTDIRSRLNTHHKC